MLGGRGLIFSLIVAASAGAASAQSTTSGDPSQGEEGRQLRFRLGPFTVAPYIRLGQVAVDTNVNYTSEDRKTDLTASGGPGLRIELPIGRVNLYGDGNVNYYWFARTREQRRFGGAAGGGLDWNASAFHVGISRIFTRTYERPSIEVDRRVLRDTWETRVSLDLDLGQRFRIEPDFSISNRQVASDTQFLGTDLGRTLTEDRYSAKVQLKYALTPKTDLVTLADQEWSRFPEAATRNVDSNRLGGGLAILSQTRLGGSVVGGVRLFRPRVPEAAGRNFTRPFVNAAIQLLGQKTRVGASYTLDTNYSAFESSQTTLPTLDTQLVSAFINRRFGRLIDVDLSGGLTMLKNDAPVVIRRLGSTDLVSRDDQFYNATFDLGFRILERLRLGLVATYNERQSNFADFGVEGLLLGASLRFNPPGLGSPGAGSSGGANSRRRSP